MKNETLTTVLLIGGLAIALVLLMNRKQTTKTVVATAGSAGITQGSSVWGAVGGIGTAIVNNIGDWMGSSGGSDGYTWGDYQPNTTQFGGSDV